MQEKLDINNLALVRATNIIPIDGVVKAISNSCYIKKNGKLFFASAMSDLLKKKGIIPPIDFAKMAEEGEDYFVNKVHMDTKILEEYLPYVSDYNSGVLFSLNGLVPDDSEHGFGNNTFSNKKCAIIEPIVNHIDNVVTLMPTDTFLEGDVKLSNESIVLIETNTYNTLSDLEKEKLSNLNIKTFTGNLKDIVYNELKNTGKYYPEKLTLSRKEKGFLNSDTKEKNLELIERVSTERDIPMVLYFDAFIGQNDYVDKLGPINKHYDNARIVIDYYMKLFFTKLFEVMNVNDEIKNNLNDDPNYEYYLKKLVEIIEEYGIDNYKNYLDKYNKALEMLRDDNKLLTPDQIVDQVKSVKKKR